MEEVPDIEQRRKLYVKLIKAFKQQDCDTLFDCVGVDPVLDELLKMESG